MKDILELLELIKSCRPEIQEAINSILSYGPEIKSLINPLVDGFTATKTRMVKNFQDDGFTRAEAIQLTCNTFQELSNSLNNAKKG